MKTQIKIRRKVLSQNVPIVFTSSHKQRAITDTAKELCDFIETRIPCPLSLQDLFKTSCLIGKRINHKFTDEGSGDLQWYYGIMLGCLDEEKTYCIAYKGEDDQYH